jgi:hypothetical protein
MIRPPTLNHSVILTQVLPAIVWHGRYPLHGRDFIHTFFDCSPNVACGDAREIFDVGLCGWRLVGVKEGRGMGEGGREGRMGDWDRDRYGMEKRWSAI